MATASKPGVGKRVKQARLKADLSQRELAAQAGVTGSYVSLVEAGQRVPTLDVLREFAGPLGVAAAWLETGYVNGKVTSG